MSAERTGWNVSAVPAGMCVMLNSFTVVPVLVRLKRWLNYDQYKELKEYTDMVTYLPWKWFVSLAISSPGKITISVVRATNAFTRPAPC